ncbi:MAG: hypothetical protein COA36_13770 [Desulfotalea sp.]|nr:MAG: hypothetical protein COA36_13770 [Desulfotalea sp.]
MFTKQESTSLQSYLALAPNPDATFTYEELKGYLFGLAMTPEKLPPNTWIPVIFGDEPPFPTPQNKIKNMNTCLTQVYNRLSVKFEEGKLHFPFNLEELDTETIEVLYAWVSGFEEALALCDHIWDPEEYEGIPKQLTQQLYHSLMTVQGLVDPEEVMDFFENMPQETFKEVFPNEDNSYDDREMQVQMFLFASLPLAVETIQNYARIVEKILTKSNSDKKPGKMKKSNVIKVNFGQKK